MQDVRRRPLEKRTGIRVAVLRMSPLHTACLGFRVYGLEFRVKMGRETRARRRQRNHRGLCHRSGGARSSRRARNSNRPPLFAPRHPENKSLIQFSVFFVFNFFETNHVLCKTLFSAKNCFLSKSVRWIAIL